MSRPQSGFLNVAVNMRNVYNRIDVSGTDNFGFSSATVNVYPPHDRTGRKRRMSRNANGEGSVWQRKDGRWCAAACLPVLTGGRRRIVTHGRPARMPKAKLRDMLDKAARDIVATPANLTVGEDLTEWLAHIRNMSEPAPTFRNEHPATCRSAHRQTPVSPSHHPRCPAHGRHQAQ